ncbi:MAG: RNA polymerase sigma-70 factor (ECF subfamily) [Candidatus Azotimanducaceae bacterium]|jgi:RNA polymerase sigma-70 factor (ECF subfamily)
MDDLMAHEADRALARALIAGDEQQFDRFFTEYFERLFRFAITRLDTDEHAAQDIVQSTLINAMRGIAGYRGEASMFTWLCQICRNEINAHFRKLARSVPIVAEDDDAIRPILEALEADPEDDPEFRVQGLQLTRLIQEVLDHLPVNYGNALEWKYIEGFSVSEIAVRLQVTELAAQSTLARARTAFRDALVQLSPQLAGQSS